MLDFILDFLKWKALLWQDFEILGSASLYNAYGYVPPQRVWFLGLLVWKQVYTSPNFVWNRVLFSKELWECMNVFIVSIPNELERKKNMPIQNLWRILFLLLSNLSNGDIISALRPSSLKTGVKNDIFWSEIGDLENRAAHPHQEFPRSTPTPPGTLNSRTVVELDKRVNFNFRVFVFVFVFFLSS